MGPREACGDFELPEYLTFGLKRHQCRHIFAIVTMPPFEDC